MNRVGGAVDQRRGSVAGFIGIDRTGHALTNGGGHCGTRKTAGCGSSGKCAFENICEHTGNIAGVQDQDDHRAQ